MASLGVGRVSALTGINGDFVVQEYPVPEPVAGTVLLKTELSGICATDVHIRHGRWPGMQFPVILGHENVGQIIALGEGVSADFLGNELKVGDRVVAKGGTCGRCYYCTIANSPRLCRNPGGISYGISSVANREPFFGGGFGEYLYLSNPNTVVFKTAADARTAVLTEPMATAISGVDRIKIRLGDAVVVQGAGAIGLLALAAAKLSGATKLTMVGAPAGRLELARKLGADVVINIEEVTDPSERAKIVKENTPGGLGADAVLGCVGIPSAVTEGLTYLRRGSGKMVEIGNALDAGSAEINPASHLVSPNATLIGHWATKTEHWIMALRVLEKGELPYAAVATHQVPLDKVGQALDAMSGKYLLDDRTAAKVAVAPNGKVWDG